MFWTHQNVRRLLLDFVLKVQNRPLQLSDKIHINGNDFYQDFGLSSMQLVELGAFINSFFHFFDTQNPPNLLANAKVDSWVEKILMVRSEKDLYLSFQSSGTSGDSKLISHSIESINREIEFLHLQIKQPKRLITFVPSNHIYGFLFTIVLPELWNIPVINASNLDFFNFSLGDLIVATPFNWNYIYNSLNNKNITCAGISSGAPLNDQFYTQLESVGFQITEIYGTTETAGIGYRNKANSPFKLFPYWTFDADVKNIVRSYDQQLFPLLDHIELIKETNFFVKSRIDQVVQIGGVNISLVNIQKKILSISLVKHIDVYAKAIGNGVLIGATIKLINDSDDTKANYIKAINQLLAPNEIPTIITFV